MELISSEPIPEQPSSKEVVLLAPGEGDVLIFADSEVDETAELEGTFDLSGVDAGPELLDSVRIFRERSSRNPA